MTFDRFGIIEIDYHYLEENEKIAFGDEYLAEDGLWMQVGPSVGHILKEQREQEPPPFIVRRKL